MQSRCRAHHPSTHTVLKLPLFQGPLRGPLPQLAHPLPPRGLLRIPSGHQTRPRPPPAPASRDLQCSLAGLRVFAQMSPSQPRPLRDQPKVATRLPARHCPSLFSVSFCPQQTSWPKTRDVAHVLIICKDLGQRLFSVWSLLGPWHSDSAWRVGGARRVRLAGGPPLSVHGCGCRRGTGSAPPPGDQAQCPALLQWLRRQLYAHSRSPKPAMEAEATRRTPQEACGDTRRSSCCCCCCS